MSEQHKADHIWQFSIPALIKLLQLWQSLKQQFIQYIHGYQILDPFFTYVKTKIKLNTHNLSSLKPDNSKSLAVVELITRGKVREYVEDLQSTLLYHIGCISLFLYSGFWTFYLALILA